jgi:hypothetical protein
MELILVQPGRLAVPDPEAGGTLTLTVTVPFYPQTDCADVIGFRVALEVPGATEGRGDPAGPAGPAR